jgi:hypothetical protein
MLPFLRAFPQPSAYQSATHTTGLAEFYASYSTPSTIDAYSLRVDHNLTSRNRLFGRWSYTPSETTPRYGNDLAIETPTRIVVKTITGGLDTTITSRQVNSLRANYTWNDNISTNRSTSFGGATALAMSSVTGLSDTSQINFYLLQETPNPLIILKNQSSKQTQINITDAYTVAFGRHNLKFGIDWRRLHNRMSLPDYWEITQFRSAATVYSGKPEVGQVRRFYGKMEPVYNNWSVYAQDEWSVSRRLNLSYGIRWELNPAPVDATGNNPYTITGANPNTAVLAAKNTSLYKTVFTNFAPRVGVAYTVHDTDGSQTVVRAGWGLYYEMGNAIASQGYLGVGIGAIGVFNGTSYPFTQAQLDTITLSVAPPYAATVFAFDPNLKTPRVQQYSAAIEQQFGRHQTFTLSYVGAKGTNGLTSLQYYPSRVGNTNFSSSWPLVLTTNAGVSNYNSLQAKFQKTLSRNLQGLLSYTWSRNIDNGSINNTMYSLVRGNSDWDVRNNFQATFTYTLPGSYRQRAVSALLADWAIDGRISARSALPVDVLQASSFDPATGQQIYLRPNRVTNQPLYLYGSQYPGGRAINRAAFSATTSEGNLGRNIARAFNAVQADMTVHKTLAVYNRLKLQFRAEAFNVFNKANMGSVANTWTAAAASTPTFGQATNTLNDQLGGLSGIYQQGGPRSLQLVLKLQF